MKIVAIVPIKKRSERVKEKNFKIINNLPLYAFCLDKFSLCNFDELYVDTDSNEIKKYAKEKQLKVIDRLPELAANNSNGNDLLNYHSTIISSDIYFQLFITSPLLKVETINMAIDILKTNKYYDSIFTIQKIYSWFWFDKKPINYDPKILPRSQDAKPIIKETTGLYGITRKSLLKNKCRIGSRPYLLEVSENESIDLDNDFDFELVKLLLEKEN